MNLLEKFREINEVWILDFKDPKKEQNHCTEISNRFTNYFEKHNLELVDYFNVEGDCYEISHPKYNSSLTRPPNKPVMLANNSFFVAIAIFSSFGSIIV